MNWLQFMCKQFHQTADWSSVPHQCLQSLDGGQQSRRPARLRGPRSSVTDRQEVGEGNRQTGSWSQCFCLFELNLQSVGAGGPMGRAAARGGIPVCGHPSLESEWFKLKVFETVWVALLQWYSLGRVVHLQFWEKENKQKKKPVD